MAGVSLGGIGLHRGGAKVSIRKITRNDLLKNEALFSSLIKCYQQVFATEPWFEWMRCLKCPDLKWGIEKKTEVQRANFLCPRCHSKLIEFWPEQIVRQDILHEISMDLCSFWVAEFDERVVGFCWGYAITPDALEIKLENDGLADRVRQFSNGHHDHVAYQDELGVLKEFRGHGLAKRMVVLRLQDFLANDLRIGTIRTKMDPPSVTYQWFTRVGYQMISEYGDEGKRVVLARNLTTLREALG